MTDFSRRLPDVTEGAGGHVEHHNQERRQLNKINGRLDNHSAILAEHTGNYYSAANRISTLYGDLIRDRIEARRTRKHVRLLGWGYLGLAAAWAGTVAAFIL